MKHKYEINDELVLDLLLKYAFESNANECNKERRKKNQQQQPNTIKF